MTQLDDRPGTTAPHAVRSLRGKISAWTHTAGLMLRCHRNELATVGAIIAVATAMLIWFRREPVFSDDLGYWNRWNSLGSRSGMANPHRLIMAFSAEVARWVFGYSMTAYNAVGIGYGVGVVVLVYLLVRFMFPRIVALGAITLLATSTVFLQDVSLLVPDWPAVFWLLGGIVLLLYAVPREALRVGVHADARSGDQEATSPQPSTTKGNEQSDRQTLRAPFAARILSRPVVLPVVAGLCFHLMWFAKEAAAPILIAVPLFLLVATTARRAIRLTAIAAASTAAFVLVEMAIMWQLYGDPFRRFAMIMRGHVRSRLSERLGGRVDSTPDTTTAADLTTGGSAINAEAAEAARTAFADWWALAERYIDPISSTWNGTALLWLTAAALFITLIAGSRRLWILAIPALVGTAATVFAVGSITPLVPLLSMKFRYLSLGWVFLMPLIAAAAWVAAKHVATLYTDRPRNLNTAGITVLVLIVTPTAALGLIAATENPIFAQNGSNGLQQAVRYIERLQDAEIPINHIITDGRTVQGLRIQMGGDPEDVLHQAHESYSRAQPGDIVIMNRKRAGLPTAPRRHNDPLPEWLLIPPLEWRYLGDADFADIFIYYITDEWEPPPTLSVTGRDMSQVTRGTQLDGEHAEFGWQRDGAGIFLWMQDIRHARFVTGQGSHPRAAHSEGAEHLVLTDAGRFGARVELHMTADIRIGGVWLRTYGADGEMRQNARMYQATEEERTSTPQFAVDIDSMRSTSFATSLEVDPELDKTFRVVGFASGSGIVTIDRIAVSTLQGP